MSKSIFLKPELYNSKSNKCFNNDFIGNYNLLSVVSEGSDDEKQ